MDISRVALAEAESIDKELAGFDHGLRHIPSQRAADRPRGLDDLAGGLDVANLTEAFGFDAGTHSEQPLQLIQQSEFERHVGAEQVLYINVTGESLTGRSVKRADCGSPSANSR